MIEENPSRIRVELIVVDGRYHHYVPSDMARPVTGGRSSVSELSGFDIAARAAAFRTLGSRK